MSFKEIASTFEEEFKIEIDTDLSHIIEGSSNALIFFQNKKDKDTFLRENKQKQTFNVSSTKKGKKGTFQVFIKNANKLSEEQWHIIAERKNLPANKVRNSTYGTTISWSTEDEATKFAMRIIQYEGNKYKDNYTQTPNGNTNHRLQGYPRRYTKETKRGPQRRSRASSQEHPQLRLRTGDALHPQHLRTTVESEIRQQGNKDTQSMGKEDRRKQNTRSWTCSIRKPGNGKKSDDRTLGLGANIQKIETTQLPPPLPHRNNRLKREKGNFKINKRVKATPFLKPARRKEITHKTIRQWVEQRSRS